MRCARNAKASKLSYSFKLFMYEINANGALCSAKAANVSLFFELRTASNAGHLACFYWISSYLATGHTAFYFLIFAMPNALMAVQERSSNRAAIFRFNAWGKPHANLIISKIVVLSIQENNDPQNLLSGRKYKLKTTKKGVVCVLIWRLLIKFWGCLQY